MLRGRGLILAGLLAGILHGVLIGLIVIRLLRIGLFRLVTLRLLRDLPVLRVGRRTGLAPVAAAAGLGLCLRRVGSLLLIGISGLSLLHGLLIRLRLIAICRVLGRPVDWRRSR